MSAHFGDGTSDSAKAVAVISGGKFLVAGSSNGDLALACYTADGLTDTGFGGGDWVATQDFGNDDWGGAIALFPDGDVLVVGSSGYSGYYNSYSSVVVARYNADGITDGGFGGGDGAAVGPQSYGARAGVGLAVLPGGKILTSAGRGVARFNADGSIDPTFDGQDGLFDVDGLAEANAIALQSGRVVAAGRTPSEDDSDFAGGGWASFRSAPGTSSG